MMGSFGKYLRHFLAVILGIIVAAIAQRLGVDYDKQAAATVIDGVLNLIVPGIVLWVYAWAEKFLKRFPNLDPEGYTGRQLIKAKAAADPHLRS